jgi:uncharacterized protein (TIGR02145 family)
MKKIITTLALALIVSLTINAQDTIRSIEAGDWTKTLDKDVTYTISSDGDNISVKEGASELQSLALPAIITFKRIDPSTIDEGIIIDNIKWATRNVAAPGHFADNPEDAGMFYQWNRAIGWSATDPLVASDGEALWDSSNATGTTWETANNVCPTGWRVPTTEEQQSLFNSGGEWVTTPVNGRIFGSGENTLFLPAAGYRIGSSSALSNAGAFGHYWSSTSNNATTSYDLRFSSGSTVDPGYNNGRAYGFSVRCVAE